MIQEIKYKGYTASPSDYECPDGELAGVMNVVPEDGALKAVVPAEVMGSVGDSSVKFIHATTTQKNCIIASNDNKHLYWVQRDEFSDTEKWVEISNLNLDKNILLSINAIGNTLLVHCGDGIHYVLWKVSANGGSYKHLGTHIPECPLSFGLQGRFITGPETIVSILGGAGQLNEYDAGLTQYRKALTDSVFGMINKYLKEKVNDSGYFLYPFFVRYALRLFDGSLTMHSAPIFMQCASGETPQVVVNSETYRSNATKNEKFNAACEVIGLVHELDYILTDGNAKNSLEEWSDIVSSVDIFISAPLYTIDFNGEVKSVVNNSAPLSTSVCSLLKKNKDKTWQKSRYQLHSTKEMWEKATDGTEGAYSIKGSRFFLPSPKGGDSLNKKITSNSSFYHVASIDIQDLNAEERTIVDMRDVDLSSLITREVMSDDFDSHDKLFAKESFTYNNRLNLRGISKTYFKGFSPDTMMCYSDGFVGKTEDGAYTDTSNDMVSSYTYTVEIENSYGSFTLESGSGTLATIQGSIFFYYPNINARKVMITESRPKAGGGSEIITNTYTLAKHNFLNGAYYYQPYILSGSDNVITVITTGTGTRRRAPSKGNNASFVFMPNKIYTSEVNNPFLFPASMINTVSGGTVLGVSTAAKPLSEGQFGQFPLYAFTDEGVWALEVSSTGTYVARQPITRDVLLKNSKGEYNTKSITQIDSSVLFATDRGIMLLSGSNTQCISDVLDEETLFSASSLPKGEKVLELAKINAEQLDYTPFKEFIRDCGMVYDYVHQRIIVFNPSKRYAYVYSLKDKAWGMMPSKVSDAIKSYPEALAMTIDGELIDFSKEEQSLAEDETTGYDTGIGAEEEATDSPIVIRSPQIVNPNQPGTTIDPTIIQHNKKINGVIFTRPFKLGDPNMLKTIDTIIQRGNINKKHVSQVLYGSRDLQKWYVVASSTDAYLRGFRGSPYKYFRLALILNMDAGESLYGCTVQYQPRLTNKPR